MLDTVEKSLLGTRDLSLSNLEGLLSSMLGGAIDFADIYCQSIHSESLVLEEGRIKSATTHVDQGVGLRAISGEKTGFAYSDDLVLSALQDAALAAKGIARHQSSGIIKIPTQHRLIRPIYGSDNPLLSLNAQDKIALLKKVEHYARQLDPKVIQVVVSLVGSFETILVLNSEGTYQADRRPMVRFTVNVIVKDAKGNRESGSAGGGGRRDYGYFLEDNRAFDYADQAVRLALLNLTAQAAPAGMMPVVLGSGWPGVLLHEAVGHGLEADFNRKKTSIYAGCIGEPVASPLCTIVDDGTIMNARGSLSIDDEGEPTQRTILIEKGILKGYMQDKLNAKLMGVRSTGNGRRQSYAHLPMPRMTNTFMLSGSHSQEEMIARVENGLYAVNFSGGSVDITSGNFVFSTSEAYRIQNGRITYPVKGATLIGNGPQIMKKISMVGHDLAFDPGIGTCGKDGQSVPVGVGQPTMLVDELTVGGTQV